MVLKDLADKLNIELSSSIARFGGNEMLFVKFLKKLPDDNTFKALEESFLNKDYDEMERSAHTLKGISANLGLNDISRLSDDIVVALRNKNLDNIDDMFKKLETSYKIALDEIVRFE